MIQIYRFEMTKSLNEIINSARHNRYGAASKKKKATLDAANVANARNKELYNGETFNKEVWIESTFYLKRDRDIDNCYLKPILDGLQLAKIIRNDRDIKSPLVIWKEKSKTDFILIRLSDTPIFMGEPVYIPKYGHANCQR